MLDRKICIHSQQKRKHSLPTLSSTPKPDIFISVSNSIFPLHRTKMMDSSLIKRLQPTKQILVVNQNLDIKSVQSVLSYYYGMSIEVGRVEELYQIFEVVRTLKLKNLQKDLVTTIEDDIKQHNAFVILQFSYQYGIERLATVCLQYLQQQQFEPVKYQQYSLYECEFILFQIIIRRHHTLRMNNKINGLSQEVLQWVISNYCRRHLLGADIKQMLYDKYIHSWNNSKNYESNKSSIKFHKVQLIKNIGQSTTIYGNDSEKRSKEQFQNAPQKAFSPIRARKFSVEIEKELKLNGLNYESQPELRNNIVASIDNSSPILSFKQCLNASEEIGVFKKNKKVEEHKKMEVKLAKSQQDQMLEHIQELGNNMSYCIHNPKISKAKSIIFHEVIEEEIEESTDIKNKRHYRRHSKSIQQPQFGAYTFYK